MNVPMVGEIAVPAACLIRPDGYLVWAAEDEPDTASLRDALTTWFGARRC
ncbi:hypothetical protein [Amycolatopsis taiwanensis]|nr:hypothetical protein [Amycolatopsis taiwanensis]